MPENPSSPLAVLAERAGTAGFEPWLFHRDGWDWCWRSWDRVGDHVARGVEVLRGAAATARIGYEARQHPDAVTAGLTIRATGLTAVPITRESRDARTDEYDLWLEVGDGAPETGKTPDCIVLPPVSSALDSTPPRRMALDAAPGEISLPDREQLTAGELIQAARRLSDVANPGARRIIVCATPALEPSTALLLETWTLLHGAAWVLEPQTSAFVETVLWARPTRVWGRAYELDQLAARLQVRKHRRRSRITGVVAVGDDEVDAGPWRELGVEVDSLPTTLCRTAV